MIITPLTDSIEQKLMGQLRLLISVFMAPNILYTIHEGPMLNESNPQALITFL